MKQKSKQDFSQILNSGAKVDEIFVDKSNPQGIDPYHDTELEIETDSIQIKRSQALESFYKLINQPMSFGEYTANILRICLEQIRSEAGTLFEYDPVTRDYIFRAVAGKSSKNLLKVRVPRGTGIVGRVCENKKPEMLSLLKNKELHLKTIGNLVGFEARDVLACPIIIQGRAFGCIELLNPIGDSLFNHSDMELLQQLCSDASIAIENRLILAKLSKTSEEKNKEDEKKAA